MEPITVLSPLGFNRSEAQRVSKRVPALDGVRLGILTNSKPNVNLLLAKVAEGLSARFRMEEILNKSKPKASLPAEGLESYAKEVQAVITAIGD